MQRWSGRFLVPGLLVLVLGGALAAQTQPSLPDAPTPQQPTAPPAPAPQNIPDAPSSKRPATGFPPGTPPPKSAPDAPADTGAPPPPTITTVAPGQAPRSRTNAQDQLFTLTKNVNFVVVPVTVKDLSGHLVQGLQPDDFNIYEDGVRQDIKFFTSDPFPLSAAVVIDVGLPDIELQKVTKGLTALASAFSQFDELAVYTYGNTWRKDNDFTAVNDSLLESLRRLKDRHGSMGGPPVVGGPLGQQPGNVGGRPVDPGQPSIAVPRKGEEENSHVLNDAILAAAKDLAKRDRSRRKVIFVISDGREIGSDAKYSEVLRVLLAEQIQVYGLGVGSAAIPIYGRLEKIPVPRRGVGDILPKYASATGGQVFNEFSEKAIETAYGRLTSEARNQYTIGYTTRSTLANTYRTIEVQVKRPGLKIYAKDGYYPLPPPP